MTPTQTPDANDARTVVKTLDEGDVIRVPQYKNALEVTYCGDLNGEANAFIGVEFHNDAKKTSAEKHMVVNRHSGRVYLQAGATDKGEVRRINVVTRADGDGGSGGDDQADREVDDVADVRHVMPDRGNIHLVAHPDADTALCGFGCGGLRAAGRELGDAADAAHLGAFVNAREDMCPECREAFNDAVFPREGR